MMRPRTNSQIAQRCCHEPLSELNICPISSEVNNCMKNGNARAPTASDAATAINTGRLPADTAAKTSEETNMAATGADDVPKASTVIINPYNKTPLNKFIRRPAAKIIGQAQTDRMVFPG